MLRSSATLCCLMVGILFAHVCLGEDSSKLTTLVPEGDWKVAVEKLGFADGPSCDQAGNLYFSDLKNKVVFRIGPDGKQEKVLDIGGSGTKLGPDGRLYVCGGGRIAAYDLNTKAETILAQGVQPNDLVITYSGNIYFTETGKKQVTLLKIASKEVSSVDVGISKPNGISLSPDQKTLAVSDYGGTNVWTFTIKDDGTLTDKKPAMTMKTPKDKPEVASGDGMTTDTAGNYYVTSAVGVQVFASNGEWLGVLPKPGTGPLTSAGFAGANRETLYITCGDKLYSRKTNTQGALFFQKP